MFPSRFLRHVVLTVSALTALACGDYTRSTDLSQQHKLGLPTLTVQASFTMLSGATRARAVRWGPDHSRIGQNFSAIVGPEGGTLSLPGSDFTMNIPSGALSAPTTITVVSKAGAYVAYEMLPHGLRFLKPVTAVQGLENTAAYGTSAGNSVRAAYLPEGNDNIDVDDSASPSELEASTTHYYGPQQVAGTQVWIINHFSRYILISGVWTCVDECVR